MVDAFHEVRFPLRVALGTSGGPVRRTDIVSLSNGRENRNRRWLDARPLLRADLEGEPADIAALGVTLDYQDA